MPLRYSERDTYITRKILQFVPLPKPSLFSHLSLSDPEAPSPFLDLIFQTLFLLAKPDCHVQ